MKPVDPGFITYMQANQRFLVGELYTFAFSDGNFDYFTDLDQSIVYGGNTFSALGLRIEGLRYRIGVGFQVDEQEVKISAYPGETLGGASFFSAVESGLLDGAYLTRQRAFWAVSDGRPYIDFQTTPLQVVTLFIGLVSTISKIGRSHVELKLKSPLKLLDIDMPRNTFQPSCQWTLYDAGCTLDRASFTTSFTVSVADAASVTPTVGINQTGSDGVPNYYQGRMIFTTGANSNIEFVIGNNDAAKFYMQYPFLTVPEPGDTFTASLGCAKTSDTCNLKFSNLVNFRGFPRVPPVIASV